jgi:hypothetical protein
MMVHGIEGMSPDQIVFEIDRGAKFVFYRYCISVLILTFRRSSDVYFIPTGAGSVSKGLPWTMLTVALGWWGIPWGPIWSVQSLITNFQGGEDVTENFYAQFRAGGGVSPAITPR